jgi:hypothetical protein
MPDAEERVLPGDTGDARSPFRGAWRLTREEDGWVGRARVLVSVVRVSGVLRAPLLGQSAVPLSWGVRESPAWVRGSVETEEAELSGGVALSHSWTKLRIP